VDLDRARGVMFGLAIGDSLGNISEGMPPSEREYRHREIREYLPNRRAGGKAVGLPSDDTQLAFWTLEQMIKDRGFNSNIKPGTRIGGRSGEDKGEGEIGKR
jgi:ADP-ribosyl-[dinitrogen reductase] hydrolase